MQDVEIRKGDILTPKPKYDFILKKTLDGPIYMKKVQGESFIWLGGECFMFQGVMVYIDEVLIWKKGGKRATPIWQKIKKNSESFDPADFFDIIKPKERNET